MLRQQASEKPQGREPRAKDGPACRGRGLWGVERQVTADGRLRRLLPRHLPPKGRPRRSRKFAPPRSSGANPGKNPKPPTSEGCVFRDGGANAESHAVFSRGPNLQRQPLSIHLGCSPSHSAAIIWPSMRQAMLLSTSIGGYSSRQSAGDAARQTRRIKDVIKTSPGNTLLRTLRSR